MRYVVTIVAGLLLPLLAACGDSGMGPGEVEEITELPRQLTASEVEVIRTSNRFAFGLAGQLSHPDSSFFISPLSASMMLGMLMNGADGETHAQIRDALGFGELPEEEINGSYRSLIDLLVGLDPTVETAIGNAVWIQEGFPVRTAFQDRVREHFDARVENLDFASPSAVETMNGWASDATNGRIDEIVEPPIDPDIVAFLMNAIYFKGIWTVQFEPEKTEPRPFHLSDGSTVQVQMMQSDDVQGAYARSEEYIAADLPYGGEAFVMTVVLPPEDARLDAFVRSLDAELWGRIVDDLRRDELAVSLPRFEMEYERLLNDDLKALGMTDVFEEARADLSRMSEVDLFLDEARQKTFVKVNEEGTEAAAVTSGGAVPTSGPLPFRVDRPFLFVIRERLSGTILFMGAVVEPPTG